MTITLLIGIEIFGLCYVRNAICMSSRASDLHNLVLVPHDQNYHKDAIMFDGNINDTWTAKVSWGHGFSFYPLQSQRFVLWTCLTQEVWIVRVLVQKQIFFLNYIYFKILHLTPNSKFSIPIESWSYILNYENFLKITKFLQYWSFFLTIK